jgi:IS1 family transposase
VGPYRHSEGRHHRVGVPSPRPVSHQTGRRIRSQARSRRANRRVASTDLSCPSNWCHYPALAACTRYQDETLRNLPCRRLQADEIWSYVGGKDKNLSTEKKEQGLGSIWTWTVICADTKLIPSWMVGSRDAASAYELMQDVASRLRGRVQLTTDGHRPYLEAVKAAFGMDIDYAMLQKMYGADPGSETRYSPAV